MREKSCMLGFAFTVPLFLNTRNPIRHPLRYCSCKIGPVILGGTSGVGLEVATYLKSKGQPIEAYSRSTGHDLALLNVSQSLISTVHGSLAVCVGAGSRRISLEEELKLYFNISSSIAKAEGVDFVVAVVRSLVLAEVRDMFSSMFPIPWVILRPGALVEPPRQPDVPDQPFKESLLVTPDIRCNGLVSRSGVARVVGDILMNKIPVSELASQVLGVYDEARMIQVPAGCVFVGQELWRQGVD